jgi:hypothetical protein
MFNKILIQIEPWLVVLPSLNNEYINIPGYIYIILTTLFVLIPFFYLMIFLAGLNAFSNLKYVQLFLSYIKFKDLNELKFYILYDVLLFYVFYVFLIKFILSAVLFLLYRFNYGYDENCMKVISLTIRKMMPYICFVLFFSVSIFLEVFTKPIFKLVLFNILITNNLYFQSFANTYLVIYYAFMGPNTHLKEKHSKFMVFVYRTCACIIFMILPIQFFLIIILY